MRVSSISNIGTRIVQDLKIHAHKLDYKYTTTMHDIFLFCFRMNKQPRERNAWLEFEFECIRPAK